MNARLAVSASVIALSLIACTTQEDGPEADADGTWVGTITTEGDVTTVVNESGSVWGGPASLVEEASIGVESGPDEYLFGQIGGVWADEDRIYVADYQVPAVRVYDTSGRYLFDIGSRGQGPGEYEEPWSVATKPNGDIVVAEIAGGRLNVYAPDGTPIHTHSSASPSRTVMPNMFLMSTSGVPYTISLNHANTEGVPRVGMRGIGADGSAGEPLFPPLTGYEPQCLNVRYMSEPYCNIPFAPSESSALTPELAWVLGANDQYAFQIHHVDGRVTKVTRHWAPVTVTDDEADYERRRIVASVRMNEPDWTWNGPSIPDHKPAFTRFLPDHSGRIWLLRDGPSRRVVDDCSESFDDSGEWLRDFRPCWVADRFLDSFAADGRYLGEVRVPPTAVVSKDVFIRDDVLVVPASDDAGTIMVKRYRLVLPGEGS
jgi:hypothetical protein